MRSVPWFILSSPGMSAEHFLLLHVSSSTKRVCKIQQEFEGEYTICRDYLVQVHQLWDALPHDLK